MTLKEALRLIACSLLLWLLVLLPAADRHLAQAASSPKAAPRAARTPLDADGRMHFSAEDRCPVCAMRATTNPKFTSAIELRDGRTFYFCGTGCMIRSWLHPEVFLNVTKKDLRRAVVQDYFSGEHVDAMDVYWVAGSDVVGPMGPALVPLKSKGDLNAFQRRHGGTTIFRLADMTPEKWQDITGKKSRP